MDISVQDEANNDDIIDVIRDVVYSSSDDEEEGTWGGSMPGKRPNIERNREEGALRLYNDYFANNCIYPNEHFERRFRLTRDIVLEISNRLEFHDVFFTQRCDCTGRLGFTSHQKITAALRLLAYGSAADSLDETLRMSETTALDCLDHFAEGIVELYAEEYLRSPTEEDMKLILGRAEGLGFPGMMGSIDCCKWEWKNCPVALQGQFQGKEGVPTVTLEAIADDRLWIWHAFFGMPGCLNDINVLEASPLLNKIVDGTYPPPIRYKIAGEHRTIPYWLADGIYPKWPSFVQSVTEPNTQKEKLLAKSQEGRRKDVERAFGVLQSRWHILARPCRLWGREKMKKIMMCCVILHNRMVEVRCKTDSRAQISIQTSSDLVVGENAVPMYALRRSGSVTVPPPGTIAALCAAKDMTNDIQEYFRAKQLVMDHLWAEAGDSSS